MWVNPGRVLSLEVQITPDLGPAPSGSRDLGGVLVNPECSLSLGVTSRTLWTQGQGWRAPDPVIPRALPVGGFSWFLGICTGNLNLSWEAGWGVRAFGSVCSCGPGNTRDWRAPGLRGPTALVGGSRSRSGSEQGGSELVQTGSDPREVELIPRTKRQKFCHFEKLPKQSKNFGTESLFEKTQYHNNRLWLLRRSCLCCCWLGYPRGSRLRTT